MTPDERADLAFDRIAALCGDHPKLIQIVASAHPQYPTVYVYGDLGLSDDARTEMRQALEPLGVALGFRQIYISVRPKSLNTQP